MKFWFRILLLPLVIALVIRKSFLITPLPSNIKVSHIPEEKLPKPLSFTYDTTNTHLRSARKLYQQLFFGVESIGLDRQTGRQYILDRYGFLYTSPNSTSKIEKIAYVGPGRPLGYHYNPRDHSLVICDSLKGLTRIDLNSLDLSILSNRVSIDSPIDPDSPINYANDLDIDSDTGDVYFTDSTPISPALNRDGYYDTMQSYLFTYLGGISRGRLLVRYSKNGRWFCKNKTRHSYILTPL